MLVFLHTKNITENNLLPNKYMVINGANVPPYLIGDSLQMGLRNHLRMVPP